MSAGRWFVPRGTCVVGEMVTLPASVAQQARSVLRLRAGDSVTLLDDTGLAYAVELTEVSRERVVGRVVASEAVTTEPHHHLILHQALMRAAKFEWVVQKGTELGVWAFRLVTAERSTSGLEEVSPQKLARWRSIAAEAAEQSNRGRIPTIEEPQSLRDALAGVAPDAIALLAWEGVAGDGSAPTIPAVLGYTLAQEHRGHDPHVEGPLPAVHLFVGPEGGFTTEEAALAQSLGAQIVTLGPRILRAETAAIAAATLALHALGELG
jgi:16S rRNA (uracil1498-N3)-methyltransferase